MAFDAVCIASGPSLTKEDCELVRQWKFRDQDNRLVIVTNNTFMLCPWADILYARDNKWWTVMGRDANKFKGRKYSMMGRFHTKDPVEPPAGNSGACAITLAHHLGARSVTLLGYDCKVGPDGMRHWHGRHRIGLGDAVSLPKFYGQFQAIQGKLDGCQIVNATRDTDLDLWPMVKLEDVISC